MIEFEDLNNTEYDGRRVLTLSMLNGLVKEVVEISMPDTYWVQAELASVRESRGHCYMELVETRDSIYGDEYSRTPIAQARACCWKNTWQRILPRFIKVTGEELHAGMKVLLNVKANFHEAFGFAWVVTDIDPTFTMGDMTRRRQEIIRALKEQGVYDLNKELPIPRFAKRIAVISSATAAGYGDFCNQLEENDYGFVFQTQLFAATMQGERVEQSVISALNNINECLDKDPDAFDLVVIIRGGGSTADLSGFDTLELAENVANFPLPVVTGIGHERDMSVLDLVACHSVKTPTAVAAFLIDNLADTLHNIDAAAQRISKAVSGRMERERLKLARIEQYISSAFGLLKMRAERKIDDYITRMENAINRKLLIERNKADNIEKRLPVMIAIRLEREQHRLQLLEQRTKAIDPVNILRRGYSITLYEGHAVKDATKLKKGDNVTVLLANGKRQFKVTD